MKKITKDKVSIIMPAYNSGRYISQSIESVIEQTYANWELIVVNDGSVDETRDIVNHYIARDDRIILVDNKSALKGAYNARNLGLENSTGNYIAFLDSDDVWLNSKLSIQIKEMKEKGYYASHSSYIRIDSAGKKINLIEVLESVTYKEQLKSNRIPNLTGIYDQTKIGIVKQNNIGHEDYDMWLRVLKKTPSIGMNKPLAYYRVVNGSLSSNKIKAAIWHYNILKNQEDIGFVKRCFYFFFYIYYAVSKRI
ncbi:glycosyl transferase [Vibrio sp. 10N.286.45.A3]|uniref:glycosyltransferase family 2 protein n=1 Tax=unclassified Vibrio TaxID=2614977 RepID=UPI000D344D09|nr:MULTISPECIES: glycosyltransferase family 2 protein [unclassified Vibrio]PTP00084.1 glycosyl transferase [Vibrio sp. 10N.286.45.A3]TKE77059.1 glycosyltransferase family 2 protein [Vibrio sp. F12]TKE95925.1 glycosyltransferase family 2 protein [Vibrio sp. F12]